MTQAPHHDGDASRRSDRVGAVRPTENKSARRQGTAPWKAGLVYATIGLAYAGALGVGAWTYLGLTDATGDGSANPRPAAAATASPEEETPFHEHVRRAGLTTCGVVFPALGHLVTEGSKYAIQSQWDEQAPKGRSLQTISGQEYDSDSYKGKAVGVVFASSAEETCEGSMVRVAHFDQSCQDVVRLLPEGSGRQAELSGIPLYRLGDSGGQAMLLSAGRACIVVSVARMAG